MSMFRPTCPLCREVNPPEVEGCVFCGAALTLDEHERRKRASMLAARLHRRVHPQPVDNSVDENLLDSGTSHDVSSAGEGH